MNNDISVMEDKETLLVLTSKLKELRESKELTQEAVYHDTGIHIGRIEQGNQNITFTTLVKICRYFGVSLSYFDEAVIEKSRTKADY